MRAASTSRRHILSTVVRLMSVTSPLGDLPIHMDRDGLLADEPLEDDDRGYTGSDEDDLA